jgi:hypothetical protein
MTRQELFLIGSIAFVIVGVAGISFALGQFDVLERAANAASEAKHG